MVEIIDAEQSEKWDNIVRTFSNYDVYYLNAYAKLFAVHGDGEPYLLYWEEGVYNCIIVFHKRQIPGSNYYDAITPYGYGGFLFNNNISLDTHAATCFQQEVFSSLKEEGIITLFVRYHPVTANYSSLPNFISREYIGETITIDLSDTQTIWNNLTSKNRNMIRKAISNGVKVQFGKDCHLIDTFKSIYNCTMTRDHARNYYFFGDAFYEALLSNLYKNFFVCYAIFQDRIISASIILYENSQIHYHLSGTLDEYRNLGSNNLLLYEVALWGNNNGYKTFHLGGGIGAQKDSLYKFKAAFNRNSSTHFYVGKYIIDHDIYDCLVNAKLKENPELDRSFFPRYRAI